MGMKLSLPVDRPVQSPIRAPLEWEAAIRGGEVSGAWKHDKPLNDGGLETGQFAEIRLHRTVAGLCTDFRG